jgi:hypothetical protein
LVFHVIIPFNYPYSDLKILTNSIRNYPHLIYNSETDNSWICLNPDFSDNYLVKFDLEFKKLEKWVNKFVIDGSDDDHYDYIIKSRDISEVLLFSETLYDLTNERFKNGIYGKFDIHKLKFNDANYYIANNLAANFINFSKDSYIKGNSSAFWYFLDVDNLYIDFKFPNTWNEFIEIYNIEPNFIKSLEDHTKYLTEEFEKDIRISAQLPSSIKKEVTLFHTLIFNLHIAVGFKIPSKEKKYEIHWEYFLLTHSEGSFDKEIKWFQTVNISKERFFGRGGLCHDFANKKILVFGLGALGSSLCEILVRGGLSNITISDIDVVEPGNLCRSTYNLSDIGADKIKSIYDKLSNISPYCEIIKFNNINLNNSYEEENIAFQDILKNYDYIFDCTANNSFLNYLCKYNNHIKIISFSISNKAKSLFCYNNMIINDVYSNLSINASVLNSTNDDLIYEGTGCFYPTFEASFFDINSLLHMAVKKLNYYFNYNNGELNSFKLDANFDSMVVDEQIFFKQNILGITLAVHKSILNKIINLSYQSYPNEFGGTLIGGYSSSGKHIYITDVLTPSKYFNNKTSFIGLTEDIIENLKKIHANTNGNIFYLGEWHSHPNMNNQYSSVDFNSIKSIANSDDISINNPLLTILSVTNNDSEFAFYIYNENKLYKFE